MPDTPAAPDSLCDRLQQLRQRMRSRCEAHRAASASASSSSAAAPTAVPCLLQSWRKRIEAMDDEPRPHHQRRIHRKPCCTSSASSTSSESDDPPPSCGFGPRRGPRMLHPRLERQQAVCSLSGLWGGFGFTSTSTSPPPSPEIYAKPRCRRHPYARRCQDREEDRREASE
jgi:hypothetical protein